MTAPQKRDSIAGYAIAFAIIIVALVIVSLLGMSQAEAGGVRRAACAPYHQPAAVLVPCTPPLIEYDVSDGLKGAGVDEYAFRRSPSQQRLTFLEGYYQAKQEEVQAPPQVSENDTSEPQTFSAPQPPTPPQEVPAPAEGFAATHPMLSAACASCHSGETPKGDLNIGQAVVTAQANADCESLLSMVNAIATGEMPKGKPMSEAERLQAIAELLNQ
jgi:mono/diheme cytochrome c family protein